MKTPSELLCNDPPTLRLFDCVVIRSSKVIPFFAVLLPPFLLLGLLICPVDTERPFHAAKVSVYGSTWALASTAWITKTYRRPHRLFVINWTWAMSGESDRGGGQYLPNCRWKLSDLYTFREIIWNQCWLLILAKTKKNKDDLQLVKQYFK